MTRRAMATAVAAVLGIAVSAALAWAASQLTGQRVGLAAEPLSVATGLSPRVRSAPARTRARRSDDQRGSRSTTTIARQLPATTSATATATPSPPPSRPVTVPAPSSSPAATSTVTRSSATPRGGASAPAPARRSGRRGDGGDRHDD